MEHKDAHIESFEVTTEKKVNGRTVRYYHHSQSPAIWTGVILCALGFLIACIGAVLGPNWLLCYIGGGLIVASIVVTMIMKSLGLGHG